MKKLLILIMAVAMTAAFMPVSYASDSASLGLNVTFAGSAPLTISTSPAGPFKAEEGKSLSFSVTAQDQDATKVTLSCEDLPEGASFVIASSYTSSTSAMGSFTWTPKAGQAQTDPYKMRFLAVSETTASDGTTTKETKELGVEITVSQPTTDTILPHSQITAIDADAGTITIGERNIIVQSIALYLNDNGQVSIPIISLKDLAAKFAWAKTNGDTMEVQISIPIVLTETGWKATSSYIYFNLKSVAIASVPQGTELKAVNVEQGTITVGQYANIAVGELSYIYWCEGTTSTTIKLADLAVKLQEAISAGNKVETYSFLIAQTQTGWRTMGTLASFRLRPANNPLTITTSPAGPFKAEEGKLSGFSITAHDQDATKVTLTCGELPKGATFVLSSYYTNAYGSFSWTPTADQVQDTSYKITFSAKSEATNADGTVTTEEKELVVEITVTHATTATIAVGSKLKAVDASAGTITIEDRKIIVPSTVSISASDNARWSFSITNLADLAAILAKAQSDGDTLETYWAMPIVQKDTGWEVSVSSICFLIKSTATVVIAASTPLKGVDTAANTISIGGYANIAVASTMKINWYDNSSYVIMTLSELASKLREAEAAGTAVETYSSTVTIAQTPTGWRMLRGAYVYFHAKTVTETIPVGTQIKAVDTSANTITIGERIITVPAPSQLYCYCYDNGTTYSYTSSLTALAAQLAQAQANGDTMETYGSAINISQNSTGSWVMTSTYFYVNIKSTATAVITAGTQLKAVDATASTVTLGTYNVAIPATGASIYWYDETSTAVITLAGLAAKLQAAGSDGTVETYSSSITIAQTKTGWRMLRGAYVYFHAKTVTDTIPIGSALQAVDVAKNTISIGGRALTMPSSSAPIWWYTDSTGAWTSIKLADLATALADATSAKNTVETCYAAIPITLIDGVWKISASYVCFHIKPVPVISIELSVTSLNLSNIKLGAKAQTYTYLRNKGNVSCIVDIGYEAQIAQAGVPIPGSQQGTDTFTTEIAVYGATNSSVLIPPNDRAKVGTFAPGSNQTLTLTYGAPTKLSSNITGMNTTYELRAYADVVAAAAAAVTAPPTN